MKSTAVIRTILSFIILLSTISLVVADNSLDISLRQRTNVFSGAVYAMTNNFTKNSIIAYGRMSDGHLVHLGTFETGGQGANLNEGNGVDPLISAGSVALVSLNYVLAVNAGSRSISVLRVMRSLKLRLASVTSVPGTGPVSIAVSGRIVYVASADADGQFESPLDNRGLVSGFKLLWSGRLVPIPNSIRSLENRPANVKFTPDGRFLVVSNVFAGAAKLGLPSVNQLLVFKVAAKGRLSNTPVSIATSTELNNPDGRNLPVSVGFQIVEVNGIQYVVSTEARLLGPNGEAAEPQTTSVSSWKLTSGGKLEPVDLDVFVGSSLTVGQRASCWIQFSPFLNTFWVANAGSGTISAFSFSSGRLSLVNEVVAKGDGPVDLSVSQDGKFLFQMFAGSIGVFRVENEGRGESLTLIQNPSNVPETNAQGIVAF